jgi:hypothetical protein
VVCYARHRDRREVLSKWRLSERSAYGADGRIALAACYISGSCRSATGEILSCRPSL